MEKSHKELLAGVKKLRAQALGLLKRGARLGGVVRDLDAAAAKLETRISYYASVEKPNAETPVPDREQA